MKIRKKNVYYCDFCKKHSLVPLLKHERACTLNPGRTCRMCEETRSNYQQTAQKIYDQTIKTMNEMDGDRPFTIEVKSVDLMDPVEACPACALTILRLVHKLIAERLEDWTIHLVTDFDYAKEKTAWWNDRNAEREKAW